MRLWVMPVLLEGVRSQDGSASASRREKTILYCSCVQYSRIFSSIYMEITLVKTKGNEALKQDVPYGMLALDMTTSILLAA
jgi:hypothetical protein